MIGVVAGLLAVLLAGPVPTAQAASGYVLIARYGTAVTTTDKAITLGVTYLHNGAKVKKATAKLQYRKGDSWVTEKSVKITRGKGATTVKHSVMERTYRFSVSGRAVSEEFTVRFVPARFTVSGSGLGHGTGMSQWGAYAMAREGASASDILSYYYPGTSPSTAVNNPRTVKVQVLGPPSDARTTTSLKVTSGGFTVIGDGTVLKTFTSPGTVAIGVKGTLVTAKVTLANGSVKNKTLASSSRLTLTWKTGPVTVTGAQGSYKAGNLQVTVIGNRPNVVNELAMNTDYLYGIDEMPSSWGTASAGGAAALQAQVIAARNNIITQAVRWNAQPGGVNAACDCQVFDDTRSQNFTGWKKAGGAANQPWRDAVDDTISAAGVQVVRDAGNGIVETPYFASSGSYLWGDASESGTASNADVFGTPPLAYLSHVDDPYSASAPGNPNLTWTRTVSQARAQQLFGTSEYVTALTVTARYPGGLAQSIEATTLSGAVLPLTRTAEGWRTGLGLPGAWIAGITGT